MSEYIITKEQLNFFLEHIGDHVMIPANVAHLEPIVRCRDCKYYEEYVGSCTRRRHCFAVKSDGFCAWGERRES